MYLKIIVHVTEISLGIALCNNYVTVTDAVSLIVLNCV